MVPLTYDVSRIWGVQTPLPRPSQFTWSHKKNPRNSGAPPETCPNGKYDGLREVCGD